MKKSLKLLKIIKATEQLIPIENGDFQKDYINWYNTDRVCKKLKGLVSN
ncbi:IS3 family transposase [Ruminobacter sp.]